MAAQEFWLQIGDERFVARVRRVLFRSEDPAGTKRRADKITSWRDLFVFESAQGMYLARARKRAGGDGTPTRTVADPEWRRFGSIDLLRDWLGEQIAADGAYRALASQALRAIDTPET